MLIFVFDEHLRGRIVDAVRRPTITGQTAYPLDIIAVGEVTAPPLRTPDPDLLIWAETEGRLIVCRDVSTMPAHLANHTAAGRMSPGVLLVRPNTDINDLREALELIAHAGDPDDYRDTYQYIP